MIHIQQRYINVQIDVEKIRTAMTTVCDDAHKSAKGNVNDMILLSYHQCPDTKGLRDAQATLRLVEMAEAEGCISSAEPFHLQEEYNEYMNNHEQEQTADKGKAIGNDR